MRRGVNEHWRLTGKAGLAHRWQMGVSHGIFIFIFTNCSGNLAAGAGTEPLLPPFFLSSVHTLCVYNVRILKRGGPLIDTSWPDAELSQFTLP